MSSNPQHIENLNNLKSLGFDVDEYLIDTMESWGYDEQVDMVQGVISEIRPMALRIKELEAENKALSLKNGDIVVYPECFGDKTLVFIGMAKGLDYSNDCAVICDGNAVPARLSGLIKVEDK